MQAGTLTDTLTDSILMGLCLHRDLVQDVCEVTALKIIISNRASFQGPTEASAMHNLTAHEAYWRIGSNLHR